MGQAWVGILTPPVLEKISLFLVCFEEHRTGEVILTDLP